MSSAPRILKLMESQPLTVFGIIGPITDNYRQLSEWVVSDALQPPRCSSVSFLFVRPPSQTLQSLPSAANIDYNQGRCLRILLRPRILPSCRKARREIQEQWGTFRITRRQLRRKRIKRFRGEKLTYKKSADKNVMHRQNQEIMLRYCSRA